MNKKQAAAYALGVVTIVGGAFVGKYLLAEAGAALVAAGAFWIGKVQKPPRGFHAPPVPDPGPDDETPVMRR